MLRCYLHFIMHLYSFFKNKYKIMLISFFVLDKVCIFITDFYVLS